MGIKTYNPYTPVSYTHLVSSQRKRAMALSTSLRLVQETTTRRPRAFIQIYPSSLQIRRLEQMHQGCLWRLREARLFRTEM